MKCIRIAIQCESKMWLLKEKAEARICVQEKHLNWSELMEERVLRSQLQRGKRICGIALT